ncbi:MAG: SPASM domain-containing protein [Phycisphaerae bacterium]|nr:SPASM domain-containing protein [Phycisphaerae bacterium]
MIENKQKTIAYIWADLNKSCLGTGSRIGDKIGDIAVLPRTCQRLSKAKQLDDIIVFCPADQQDNIGTLLNGHDVEIVGLNEPISNPGLIKQRKWSVNSWRGGIDEATVFDEIPTSDEIILYLRELEVYGAIGVHAEAIFIDPVLIDKLILHYYDNASAMRFAFSQSPPGLCGCMYRLDILHEMNMTKLHAGEVMAYNPGNPRADLIVEECNYKLGPEIYTCDFRFIADTKRGFNVLEKFITENPDSCEMASAEIIEKIRPYYKALGDMPKEINVEINTTISKRISGYPHNENQSRQEMTLETFTKILEGIGDYDDVCLTIGGMGEPLAHEQLPEMLRLAKKAGVFGINIQTDGILLDDRWREIFAENDVDVISVYLDGHSDEEYEKVKVQIKSMFEYYKTLAARPLLVPHMTKCHKTMGKMEEFFDYWIANADYAMIDGYSNFAGQIEDQAVMNMAPPSRSCCVKLSQSMTILANGDTTICPLDFKGEQVFGNVGKMSISELWRHGVLDELRRQHSGNCIDNELCDGCNDWHRF